MKIASQEVTIGWWNRIIATIVQLGTAVAIGLNQPDLMPDLGVVTEQGSGIIASGYALYAQCVLFGGSILTAISKIKSVRKG